MITTAIAKLILQAKKQSALTFVRSYNIKTPLSHSVPAYSAENVFRGDFNVHYTLSVPEPPEPVALGSITPDGLGIVYQTIEELNNLSELDEVIIYYPSGEYRVSGSREFWAEFEIINI